MNADHTSWQVWAKFLQRWGIDSWVAAIIEAAGPMTVLGAQFIYIGQPLLHRTLPQDHLEAMANLLEDKNQSKAFVNYLREAQIK